MVLESDLIRLEIMRLMTEMPNADKIPINVFKVNLFLYKQENVLISSKKSY